MRWIDKAEYDFSVQWEKDRHKVWEESLKLNNMNGTRFINNKYIGKPMYEVTLTLKPSTRVGIDEYEFYFRKEKKRIPAITPIVRFYASDIVDAIQAFDAKEVTKMTIEFD